MKRRTGILIFLFLPAIALSQFRINVKKNEKSYLVSWNKFQGTPDLLIGYKIYIEEGYITNRFPDTQIDSLGKLVLGWETKERKTLNFNQVSIRKPEQWGNKKVITPGFCYTIGVERLVNNPITLTESHDRATSYILPFEFLPLNKYAGKENEKIHPSKFYILPAPIKLFIHVYGDSVCFSFNNKIRRIEKIVEYNDFYLLKLKDELVKYYKPPSRPEAFGNPEIVIQSLGFIILGFVISVVLILFYIIIKALIIVNYISNNHEEVGAVLSEILEREMFSVLIIYTLVLFTNGSVITKLINNLTKASIGIEVDLFKEKYKIINPIAEIFKKHNLFQYDKIKIEILDCLSAN
ncbi:MAG: hypothetical protein V4592_19035 [Bacteroidota bacterium]